MITFVCPVCQRGGEAADELAGGQVRCTGCGGSATVPLELPCEDGPISAEAQTLTMAELKAIRRSLRP
jgi:hypothetical protein